MTAAATAITTTTTTMTSTSTITTMVETDGEAARILALMLAWFSPALPIGAFSYSHGLERLCEDGAIDDRASAEAAIRAALTAGSGWSDAVLLCAAYRAAAAGDRTAFEEAAELALALQPSRERYEESVRQGTAFLAITDAVWPGQTMRGAEEEAALPIAVALAGAAHAVPLAPLCNGFLNAFAANLVSAVVRLVPLGQTDGQRLTRDLAPAAAETARRSTAADIADVGGMALGLDVASMRHEYQHVRLFRS
ncbi:MAG: urease accessory UreF family protein [Acuticoccus sp.]